jgi:pimeloyl-ACP methyl ester carboxylesterase
MNRIARTLGALLPLVVACRSVAAPCSNEDFVTRVSGAGECLVIAAFGLPLTEPPAAMIVWLHGDQSDGGPVRSHVVPAQRIAERMAADRVLSIAVWRPGYADDQGNASSGDNHGRIDSYTKANMAAVGDAIERLKAHYAPARTVLVGHSGGAAMSANLLGMMPALADAAVLVSCPCDLRAWRAGRRWWPNSENPMAWADKVESRVKVVALTGTSDDNTSQQLAISYVNALASRHVDARFVPVPGATHNSAFRSPEVIDSVASLAK